MLYRMVKKEDDLDPSTDIENEEQLERNELIEDVCR